MSASERVVRRAEPSSGQDGVPGPSMGELLASCAAARAVSTPPRVAQAGAGAGPRDLRPREDGTGPAGA
ncbi:hypothetical protein [Streptomyces sp. NPDC006552]|uniref:hypothetical protein n=1 Tax=Streptomyces sp. NPDC006552 TaxID=3157179 RepID=UPI0033AA6C3C